MDKEEIKALQEKYKNRIPSEDEVKHLKDRIAFWEEQIKFMKNKKYQSKYTQKRIIILENNIKDTKAALLSVGIDIDLLSRNEDDLCL